MTLRSATMFIAHLRKEDNHYIEQTVSEHVRNTASYASKGVGSLALFNSAYLA